MVFLERNQNLIFKQDIGPVSLLAFQLIASFLNIRFAIELWLISIINLCETWHRSSQNWQAKPNTWYNVVEWIFFKANV